MSTHTFPLSEPESTICIFLIVRFHLLPGVEGQVKPNPLVGAVVVKNGTIVGQGIHRYEGVKHAEVLTLEEAGKNSRCAAVYINLEPCSHMCGTLAPTRTTH